jgi:hypothetical protein
MRILCLLPLVLAWLSAGASAQIYVVYFKDAKIAAKYKKNWTVVGGDPTLVGEVRAGIVHDRDANKITYSKDRNELYVADPADPTRIPYTIEGGEYVVKVRKGVVAIPGDHIARIRIHLDNQSLYGLAREYEFRMGEIQAFEEELKQLDEGGKDWSRTHRRVVDAYERLQTWLANTAYPLAAERVEKTLEKLGKDAEGAVAQRLQRALASVRTADLPAAFVQAQAAIGSDLEFHARESQHVRLVYATARISDDVAESLLLLAERMIDGFRVQMIDPYLDEDFEDTVPEDLFKEFWFGPDDIALHHKVMAEFYRWRDHETEVRGRRGIRAGLDAHAWRLEEYADVDGIVAHGLGHALARRHYKSDPQDWLSEAVGYYLSLEFLGRNNVVCIGRKPEDEKGYRVPKGDPKERGDKPLHLGLRDFYNKIALEKGERVDKLALKTLYELDGTDLSKAWSYYEYVVRREGRRGQLFLRAGCQRALAKETFILKWREDANAIFAIQGEDVFGVLEKRWRAFAEGG